MAAHEENDGRGELTIDDCGSVATFREPFSGGRAVWAESGFTSDTAGRYDESE